MSDLARLLLQTAALVYELQAVATARKDRKLEDLASMTRMILRALEAQYLSEGRSFADRN